MGQSKQGSAIEALTNIVIGFPLNFVLNITILPFTWDNDHVIRSGFITGAIFTVVSFVRQMYIRRWFNNIKAYWNMEKKMSKTNELTMSFMENYADAIIGGLDEAEATQCSIGIVFIDKSPEVQADLYARIVETWAGIEVNARFVATEHIIAEVIGG